MAAALAFAATAAVSRGPGRGRSSSSVALTFASFSVLVGLGQMAVITMGPGNVDLSIPATMTLAGTLSLKLMDGAAGTGPARAPGGAGGRACSAGRPTTS